MTPFRPTGRLTYRVKVPTRHAGWVDRSTGTRDKATAKAIDRMLEELGPRGKRAWDLLGAVVADKLSLARLYDAYATRSLEQLRAELNDVDLLPFIERWQTWLEGRVTPETADRYEVHLRTIPGDRPTWPRSSLTAAAAESWLSHLRVSGPTKRKYFAALQSFLGYVRSIG